MDAILDGSRELRRSARTQVQVSARYVSDSLCAEGVVTDISPDGLFFSSDYLDSRGEPVRVWLEIPWRSQPLELCGEVCWVSDSPECGGMGIRFIGLTMEDRMLLSSLGLSAMAQHEASMAVG